MDPILLTRDLIGIPSPTGSEGAVVGFVADVLARRGWDVVRQQVSPGRDNLYATLGAPVVVLSTHLDVVPPHLPLRETDADLIGRGACDAKGIAAAMIATAERLRERGVGGVGLLFVVGEEDGSDGALAAATLEPKGRFLINGEPTENRLCIGHAGALRVVLEAEGVAAHSAYPDEGRSAIHLLLPALERVRCMVLPTHPVLGASTLNIGRLDGGVAPNVLAPSARAEILVRTVEPSGPLRQAIRTAAGEGVQVRFPLDIPPVVSDPLPGWETTIARYTSDLPLLASWGRGYLLGPGSIRVAHTDHESVPKRALLQAVDLYEQLTLQLLALV